MGDFPDVEDWEDQFSPVKAEDVCEAIARSSTRDWPDGYTFHGRFEQQALEDVIDEYAGEGDILEVGCSTGETTRELTNIAPEAEVTGIDTFESRVEEARNRHRQVDSYRQFLGNTLSQLENGQSAHEALNSSQIPDSPPEWLDTLLSSREEYPLSGFHELQFQDTPAAVEQSCERINQVENNDLADAIEQELENLPDTSHIEYAISGALEMAEKLESDSFDLVFAPNSVGTFPENGAFRGYVDDRRKESELYQQASESLDHAEFEEFLTDSRHKARQAFLNLYMQRFLDQASTVVKPEGHLLLNDGNQYLLGQHTGDGWRVKELRGSTIEGEAGRCRMQKEQGPEEKYGEWLRHMDDSDYTVEMIDKTS